MEKLNTEDGKQIVFIQTEQSGELVEIKVEEVETIETEKTNESES